jgi:hypothetical protein
LLEVGFMKRVKSKAVQYWQHPFFGIKHDLMELSPTTKLILTAVLSSFAAIFQSAEGYVPGIGFFVLNIKPVIDTVYLFDEVLDTYKHLYKGAFGRIVIKVSE